MLIRYYKQFNFKYSYFLVAFGIIGVFLLIFLSYTPKEYVFKGLEKHNINQLQKIPLLSTDLFYSQQSFSNGLGGVDLEIKNNYLQIKNTGLTDQNHFFSIDFNKINKQPRVYIVQNGDTIYDIAKEFKVSEETIILENNIKNGLIKKGQELTIYPISGIRYKVKDTDTLSKIAKTYKSDINKIKTYNEIKDSTNLIAGEYIFIPGGDKELAKQKNIKKIQPVRKHYASSFSGKYAGWVKNWHGGYYRRYSSRINYGYWTHPLPGSLWVRGVSRSHPAVDMAAPIGTPILAAASGTVLKAYQGGWNQGCGKGVLIKHPNGVRTLYCHASKVIVSKGQWVTKGQKIAEVGSTGNSRGAHLHFAIQGASNPF